jgi:hypothetical protein
MVLKNTLTKIINYYLVRKPTERSVAVFTRGKDIFRPDLFF